MPIAVRDYTWEETDKKLFITVPLKGVKANKVDIFSTEEYVKVSYPPYFFECLLKDPVDEKNSTAQIGGGTVIFKLEKQNAGMWNQLQSDDAKDKEKFKERRELALKRAHEKVAEEKKEKEEKKRELEKFAINQQIQQEDVERKRIEDIKESERKQATDELEKWKEEQRKAAEMEKLQKIEEIRLAAELKNTKLGTQNQERIYQSKIQSHKSSVPKHKGKKENLFEEEAGDVPLRQMGSIDVTFTPRVFPTAARESTAPQEEEWLKKQAESRRIAEIEDSDLTVEERDPVWLKDKGNSFFKSGNYQAAINVFNHAIRIQPKMPALYSNRAACHLKLGNLMKCIEDSSKALDLLTPPVPQNAASRCKAYVRRGTAFCQLELYPEGLMDYEAALKIEPQNEQLKEDAERIRQVIQGPAPTT